MEVSLRRSWLPILLAVLVAVPALAQRRSTPKPKPKPKPKAPVVDVVALKDQIARLTAERDELKATLAKQEEGQGEMASLLRSRDLAREEAESRRKELESLKQNLRENQKGGDSLLDELNQARKALEACRQETTTLKTQLQDTQAKLQGDKLQEGMLVPLSTDILPAKAMNLSRVAPKVRRVDRGVVVVNVLVSEKGDALDVRLLQGLPGDNEWIQKAHEACLEAAKRIVFDPARTADGKYRVKVWQGVGFYLD